VISNVQLLVIDPQNDFCDLPEAACPVDPATGSRIVPQLPVPGAHADMMRVAALIREASALLDEITITLDSHQRVDIAHPGFWRGEHGEAVAPFTQIRAADITTGRYRPRDERLTSYAHRYTEALEKGGRYTLMVWPVHCEIGSFGHNVHSAVRAAYNRWEDELGRSVRRVLKGENPLTEHYSALMAELPDENDVSTQLQRDLIEHMDRSGVVLIAGEASSHCVRATTEHLVEHLPSRKLDKLVLLSNCMSPVGGFEAQAESFLGAMRERGVRSMTSEAAVAWLKSERGARA
jgi:nicotinamidase/pyrazinamidase